MPWSNNGGGPKSSGPWGGGGGQGGGSGGGGPWGGGSGGGGRGGGGQGPNIDDFFKKGQNQLKNVLGDGPKGGGFGGFLFFLLLAAGAWAYMSVYTVKPEEQAVVLTFGKYDRTDGPGLGFAPWPVQTAIIEAVTTEKIVAIGSSRGGAAGSSQGRADGLMLTGDANIIDINFQVVWNIRELDKFLFNLADANATIQAVAESAMREIVGKSQLAPLLNRDRAELERQVTELLQTTLDQYDAGVNILRVTLDRADPPPQVIDAFRDVQAAEQERDTLQKRADAYYNEKVAGARGLAAQIVQQAEAYRAERVAAAQGEAERFKLILEEYSKAKEVTRKRLYLETMQGVLGGMNKTIIDQGPQSGQGVVPYLPLNELNRAARPQAAAQ